MLPRSFVPPVGTKSAISKVVAELSRGGSSLAPRVQAAAQIASVLGVANGLVFLFFTDSGGPMAFPRKRAPNPDLFIKL